MKKFTLVLTPVMDLQLDLLRGALNLASRVEVIRKGLNLLSLYVEIRSKNQSLAVLDEAGKIVERIRIL